VRGAAVFAASCASCHGNGGEGGKAGPVVSPAYLGQVSNQYLRTIVIAGRPDLGCPDFANRTPGKPMADADIADVTAWLVSNRKNEFGKPLAPAKPSQP
jgi:mono/diheme cytochrome c family protein